MKIPNLTDLMISVTDFKKQISDIISKKATKVIIRNNEPVSIVMPYEEYLTMASVIRATGEEITLSNGVVAKVCVKTTKDDIVIKTYRKMKTSGEFVLHFTHTMSNPMVDQTLTNEEMMNQYEFNRK